jgi:meiotic recombination protein SPO11
MPLASSPLTLSRNIYYQNKDLFGDNQDALDQIIDNLAFTLRLGREDLGIVGFHALFDPWSHRGC